jgi:hypothetical protein
MAMSSLVGGSGDDSNKGAVWVYRKTGAGWAQQGAKIKGSNAVGAAKQGSSVSVSANGTTAIIGGPTDNTNKGAFWVYIPATSIPAMQQVMLEERAEATAALRLDQNIPNPFTGSTTITFSVPEACVAEWEISDVSGRVIQLLRRAYAEGENTESFDPGWQQRGVLLPPEDAVRDRIEKNADCPVITLKTGKTTKKNSHAKEKHSGFGHIYHHDNPVALPALIAGSGGHGYARRLGAAGGTERHRRRIAAAHDADPARCDCFACYRTDVVQHQCQMPGSECGHDHYCRVGAFELPAGEYFHPQLRGSDRDGFAVAESGGLGRECERTLYRGQRRGT